MAGLTDALKNHQLIEIDTSIFIYHLEASPRYSSLTLQIFHQLAEGRFRGFTSILTLMELIVQPLKRGRADIAETYEILLDRLPNITVIEVDRQVARRAAELRSLYRVTPADALQISACLQRGTSAFLTSDKELRRIGDLDMIILDDFLDFS